MKGVVGKAETKAHKKQLSLHGLPDSEAGLCASDLSDAPWSVYIPSLGHGGMVLKAPVVSIKGDLCWRLAPPPLADTAGAGGSAGMWPGDRGPRVLCKPGEERDHSGSLPESELKARVLPTEPSRSAVSSVENP